MELAQFEAFVEANQWGSFRRAAEALLLSQPALSERIKRLEAEVGRPLFERLGRGVQITEAGRALLPFAEQSLKAMRDGREAARHVDAKSAGVLSIASARAVGTYVLPDIIARLRELLTVDVHMRSGRSTEVLNLVLNREADVGVGRALTHPEVDTIHLYDEAVVLVVHPRHRFALACQGKSMA